MVVVICRKVWRLSSKALRRVASTIGWGFWTLLRVSFCAVPAEYKFCTPFLHTLIGRGILSKYQYHILVDTLGYHNFLFQILYDSMTSVLSIFRFVTHLSFLCGSQLIQISVFIAQTAIKTEIWISFFLFLLLFFVLFCFVFVFCFMRGGSELPQQNIQL